MSAPGRVQSKHLFTSLPLTGSYDEQVAAELASRAGDMAKMGEGMAKVMEVSSQAGRQ